MVTESAPGRHLQTTDVWQSGVDWFNNYFHLPSYLLGVISLASLTFCSKVFVDVRNNGFTNSRFYTTTKQLTSFDLPKLKAPSLSKKQPKIVRKEVPATKAAKPARRRAHSSAARVQRARRV